MNHLTSLEGALTDFQTDLGGAAGYPVSSSTKRIKSAVQALKDSNGFRECSTVDATNLLSSIEWIKQTIKWDQGLRTQLEHRQIRSAVKALHIAAKELNRKIDEIEGPIEEECKAMIARGSIVEALAKVQKLTRIETREKILLECCSNYISIKEENSFKTALLEAIEFCAKKSNPLKPEVERSALLEVCSAALFKLNPPKLVITLVDEIQRPGGRSDILRLLADKSFEGNNPLRAEMYISQIRAVPIRDRYFQQFCIIFYTPANSFHLTAMAGKISDIRVRYETLKTLFQFSERNYSPAPCLDQRSQTPDEVVRKLAHVYSLKDLSPDLKKYESFARERADWPGDIHAMMDNLPPELTNRFDVEELEKMKTAFGKASLFIRAPDFQGTLNLIKQGELVILPTGYKNHSTSLVFYKGFMIYCNRISKKTFNVAQIDLRALTVSDLREIHFVKHYHDCKCAGLFFRFLINKLALKTQSPLVQSLESFAPPLQTAGNCTYASMEGAALAALALWRVIGASRESEIKDLHKDLFSYFKLLKFEEYWDSASATPEEIDWYLVDNCFSRSEKEDSPPPRFERIRIIFDNIRHVTPLPFFHGEAV